MPDGNCLWPGGKHEIATHCWHVVVLNLGAEGQTPIQSAVVLTRLALAALKLFDGMGVSWGNASVCDSRALFEAACKDVSETPVRVPAWLRFQIVCAADNEFGMYTLGMDQFGLLEIEVERCAMQGRELLALVADVAQYLISEWPGDC
jgi:hypothetical protein